MWTDWLGQGEANTWTVRQRPSCQARAPQVWDRQMHSPEVERLGKVEDKSEDRETSLWRESERGETGVALGTLDST